MAAVQWYERLGESAERREFARGERMIGVINSTELRLLGFEMANIGVSPRRRATTSTMRVKQELHGRYHVTMKPRRLIGAAELLAPQP